MAAGVVVAVVLVSLVFIGLWKLLGDAKEDKDFLPEGDGWWGKGEPSQTPADETIRPFKVPYSPETMQDVRRRLASVRLAEPLEGSRFHYGFNSTYLQRVLKYWAEEFDWERTVAVLNKYPQYITNIEGIDVHFVHVRPLGVPESTKPKVLLMAHGWPGSFYEFYKIMPLLVEPQGPGATEAFEVICPSIPGYSFSEAPHKQGFNALCAARLFCKLMERLGHDKYYVQGGDWGSLIGTNMAIMRPWCVKGLHLNFVTVTGGLGRLLPSAVLGPWMPGLFGLTPTDIKRVFPCTQLLKNVLLESGYMHIQGTKPDTVGVALSDSPAGLAAYMLEKFSTWTKRENMDQEDGGLETLFELDELLVMVMIYWASGCITSSMRFYKENFSRNIFKSKDTQMPVWVPTGVAAFPNELLHAPRAWLASKYRSIVSYEYMPRGGHFAAFEQPLLLAEDVRSFVKKVEELAVPL
ncbi:LOW QUALITY PROTEIN: epoxide hydrolase 1 [Lethenteron reissneri]|uniref:LOW QUALITY PROTEIN: epoxide hydrolase 1 n=1 Tax=Lethenteron reissneri TaxID=7753 RepID=UPI002AB7148F|nr:LOW QUALITY PROTEIN: epoxide hydrolase 1 [Lethenteron reissneri]